MHHSYQLRGWDRCIRDLAPFDLGIEVDDALEMAELTQV